MKTKNTKKGAKLLRGLACTGAVLFSVSMFMTSLLIKWEGQVNIALGTTGVTGGITDSYYAIDYPDRQAYLKASDEHDARTEREGAVLVKNEGNALPLASSERRVTLFGRSTADPVYRGNSGGPSADGSRLVSLRSALEAEKFVINQTMYDAYKNSDVSRVKVAVENKDGVKSSIGEVPASFYTSALQNSYTNDYNDAAIVMFSRDGGEGRDLFYSDADGVRQLSLHQNEADLLKMIKESGKFSKVIVLINSAYPMELDWVEEGQYGVDACLWIGGTGLKGFTGVADLLVGKADPSGHFVDTYATNSLSSAAAQNAFDYTAFTNGAGNYIVEAEGIYVGYKYYETRYHDQVMGIHNATSTAGVFASENGWNYAEEMGYPFGYGKSYTTFTQTLKSVEWDQTAHTVTAKVQVENNGTTAYEGKSKSVVQLYVSLPYAEGQAEKSAIQLIDFAKTKELGAGEKEEITITFDDYIFATYDENATNGADPSKKGCYVFDKGDYYFAIGDDVHDALNNVLAKKAQTGMTDHLGNVVAGDEDKTVVVPLSATDNKTYAKSQYSGNIVSNRLEDVNINTFYDNDPVTYLTRADWNTFPKTYSGLEATDEMIKQMNDKTYTKPANAPDYNSITTGAEVTLNFIDMRNVEYDDPKWDTFLDQLTVTDMCAMVGESFGQPAVVNVGKQANANSDGPAGPQGALSTMRVNEVVAASTWSKEILRERGLFIGQDCIYVGITQLWSPGCNIHRTPYSGRNFEYYSEDSVMSYVCASVQCSAMQEKGCNAAPKHFAGNDQETNRGELCIYTTEQAFRQGPLKGFEGAFTEGGALGTMMSCSRIGNYHTYTCKSVLTGIMREEWNFHGITITDSVAGWTLDNPTLVSFAAGTDTFNARAASGSELKKYIVQKKDGYLLSLLRETSHRFFYSMVRSNNINGLESGVAVEAPEMPWWKTAIYTLDVVLGAITVCAVVGFVVTAYVRKDKKEA